MTTQRHIAWVCVGTNADTAVPSWFYAFRTAESATRFVGYATNVDFTITWDIYPCEFMDWQTTLTNFRDCLNSTT